MVRGVGRGAVRAADPDVGRREGDLIPAEERPTATEMRRRLMRDDGTPICTECGETAIRDGRHLCANCTSGTSR